MTWDSDDFTDLFENAPIGIHWVGPDGIILHANRAELELMGYTREEYVGRHIAEFHVDRPVIDDLLRRPSCGEDVHGVEVRLRTKDGSVRHVIIDSNVRWDADRFVHTRCFTRDVTHLLEREQRARAEAESANRMKDEFLATLSHELRTPLNAVLGWTVMLRAGSLDAAATARALDVIERNTRAQTQLIEGLLDVSRIVTGKVRLDVRAVDPLTVIEAALDSVRPAAEAKGLRLQSILDPHAGPISGDPDRLQQVVWNLLSNAIKFTPRGGRVHVRLQRVGSHVEVVVSDSGQGIEPELLPYVFDRFRQADSTTTRAKGGLGIGLAIAKQLVELHGGAVRVESAGGGQGATFVVSLPLLVHAGAAADPVHPTARRGATPATASLAGVRVLVVDDQRDALDLLERLLARGQADVRRARTVSEALDALATWRPDVVVSDIDMRIRILSAGFQIPVAKPVEPAELIATIASLTGRLAFTSDPHAKGHA